MSSIQVIFLIIYQIIVVLSSYKDIDSSLCSGLCTCEETTQYEIPMWAVDCSMYDYEQIFLNVSIPEISASLDYSRNSLTRIVKSENFSSIGLRKLDLSKNKITFGEGRVFADFPNLLHLDLSHNELGVISPEIFFGLNKLRNLDLSFNRIGELPAAVFISLPSLDVLSLSSNPIGPFLNQIDIFTTVGLSLSPDVRVLKFDNISMTVEPSKILKNARGLEELYISDNPLSSIIVGSLPKTVRILDISGSNLSRIDSIYHSGLEVLIMNRIEGLNALDDYTFSNLSSIKEISVGYCRSLRNISGLVFGSVENWKNYSLKNFSAAGCSLNTLDNNLERFLIQLDSLDLSLNPWNCDCRIEWMKRLKNLKHTEHFQCRTPLKQKDEQILQLYNRSCIDWSPRSKLSLSYILVLLTLMTFILLIGITVYTKLHSRNRINRIIVSPSSPYSRITIEPNSVDY